MQVFRCRDLIHLNIVCVQIETVLSLIRANWMLCLVGAGSKLALLVAALLPRGGVSWSVIRSNQAQYCLYLYTNNVKMYEISTSKYLHIVLSILFSVYNLTMAN